MYQNRQHKRQVQVVQTGPRNPSLMLPAANMSDSADRVFHILELAQKIVCQLELKDLFRALPITKNLWESTRRIPDCIWARHLRRLGYPDHVVRNTSQCLRTSYVSIAQVIDCISRGVQPTSTLIKMDDVLEENWNFKSTCENHMEPPFVLRSSPPPRSKYDKTDIYTLDGNDLKLLKTDVVGEPERRIFDGHSVLMQGTNCSHIVRNLEDWSTTARFETLISNPLETYPMAKCWLFHDEHIISVLDFWPREQTKDRMTTHSMVEFWDRQGLKRGESIFPDEIAFPSTDYYSNHEHQYFSLVGSAQIMSWRLDTLDVVFEHDISAEDREKGHFFEIMEGVVTLLGSDGDILNHWTVDGRHVSKEVAAMLRKCFYSPCQEFSDGCRVLWPGPSWVPLMLYSKKGELTKRIEVHPGLSRWPYPEGEIPPGRSLTIEEDPDHATTFPNICMCGSLLFDRFFFTISRTNISSCIPGLLVVYSKEGDELISMTLHRQQWWNLTWFIDILGRLVIIYSQPNGTMDELEIIDFRDSLSRSGREGVKSPGLRVTGT